nr:MAG TPA: zinc ribbon domain protein [Caudoviricetes sp.]
MKKYKCPICSTPNFKEGKECARLKKIVCMECCRKCVYHCYKEMMYTRLCSYPRILKKENN